MVSRREVGQTPLVLFVHLFVVRRSDHVRNNGKNDEKGDRIKIILDEYVFCVC